MGRAWTVAVATAMVVAGVACGTPSGGSAESDEAWAEPTSVATLEEGTRVATGMAEATLAALGVDEARVADLPRSMCGTGEVTAETPFTRKVGRDFDLPGGYDGDLVADARAYWQEQGVAGLDVVGEGTGASILLTGVLDDQRWQVSLATNVAQDRGAIRISTPCLVSEHWDQSESLLDDEGTGS